VQRLERQGSNREISATAVHYDYYVGEGQTKTFACIIKSFNFHVESANLLVSMLAKSLEIVL
jgi:hypothetical protein